MGLGLEEELGKVIMRLWGKVGLGYKGNGPIKVMVRVWGYEWDSSVRD